MLTEQHRNCNIKLIKVNEKHQAIIYNKNNLNNFPSYDTDYKINTNYTLAMINDISNKDELFVSIYELKKITNKLKENEDYLYEFIATSNAGYQLGKDIVVFYGIKNDKISKIKEIKGLSCSTEPDSICQLNDNIICIGLQNYNMKDQVNGFALIDIYKRELHSIIGDHDVSSLYCYKENNLLLASMEIIERNIDYFSTNIYKIIENKDDKENNKIGLEKVYEYRNKTKNIVISINKVLYPSKGFIFVICTDLCDLEVVKANLNNK